MYNQLRNTHNLLTMDKDNIHELVALCSILNTLIPSLEEEYKHYFLSFFKRELAELKKGKKYPLSKWTRHNVFNHGWDLILTKYHPDDYDLHDPKEFRNYIPQTINRLWAFYWDFLENLFPDLEKEFLLLYLWDTRYQDIFIRSKCFISTSIGKESALKKID